MESFLIIIILIAALPYVLAPILIHRRQHQSAHPTLQPFDAGAFPLAPPLAAELQRNVAILERAGFTLVRDLVREDHSTRMRVVLMDTTTDDRALVIVASPKLKPQAGLCSVEFVARFEGERSLSVSNTPLPGPFAAVRGRDKERFKNVRDPARLYRIYQALLARRYGALRRAPADYRTDPAAFLSASMTRELRQQVDTGYYWLDASADAFRPTWKGAILMCWKLSQPFRDIREWRTEQRAKTLLRELHLDEHDASPTLLPPQRSPSHWNWIVVVAGVLLLLVHPDFLDSGLVVPRLSSTARIRLPAGFAVPKDFAGAVTVLEGLAGAGATPLVVQDSMGDNVPTDGVVVPVEGKRAEALVRAVQDSFLARGFYLFRLAQEFGVAGRPDTLALYPSGDRYAVLRLVGTNGANYSIGTDSIVAWLQALEREQPFVLTGIGFDWVEGRFTTKLVDPDALAQRFNAFCPDIVEQGTGSVEDLARELKRSGQLYCWWD